MSRFYSCQIIMQAKEIKKQDTMIDNLNLEVVRLKSINPADDCDSCSSLHDKLATLKSAHSSVANQLKDALDELESLKSSPACMNAIALDMIAVDAIPLPCSSCKLEQESQS